MTPVELTVRGVTLKGVAYIAPDGGHCVDIEMPGEHHVIVGAVGWNADNALMVARYLAGLALDNPELAGL